MGEKMEYEVDPRKGVVPSLLCYFASGFLTIWAFGKENYQVYFQNQDYQVALAVFFVFLAVYDGLHYDFASLVSGHLTATIFFAQWFAFKATFSVVGIFCLTLFFYAYFNLLSTTDQHPDIPQKVRRPKEGMKWKDYDYTTDLEGCNIFFFMWAAHASALVVPYEILICELTSDDLLNAQELEHAAVQANWNKWIQKELGPPMYTGWQIGVWKKLFHNYLKEVSVRFNLAIGCCLEALFCWLVYFYNWANGFVYRRMSIKTWVWSYHLMEEVEHTHISVPEMRENLTLAEKLIAWFVFDIFIVVPILLIIVPVTTIKYFPRQTLCLHGIQELAEYFFFCFVAIPFAAMGQWCEMVFKLNWSAAALENLWEVWYKEHYLRDCFQNGEEIFSLAKPHAAPLTESEMKKKIGATNSLFSCSCLNKDKKYNEKDDGSSSEFYSSDSSE